MCILQQMDWRLVLSIGGFYTWFGFVPASKTYYSDHVHVKYIPRLMFKTDYDKEGDYLDSIKHARHDKYVREFYTRNYHRWIGKKPRCTVVGDIQT